MMAIAVRYANNWCSVDPAPSNNPADVMDDRLKRLNEKARALPKSPGVYLMKDDKGRVIYVGKSASLRDRVCSYFQPATKLECKKVGMVEQIVDFEIDRDRQRSRSAARRESADQGHPAKVQRATARRQDVPVSDGDDRRRISRRLRHARAANRRASNSTARSPASGSSRKRSRCCRRRSSFAPVTWTSARTIQASDFSGRACSTRSSNAPRRAPTIIPRDVYATTSSA